MTNFDSFGLSKNLHQALGRMDFVNPTPIQEITIPLALQGLDILGSAQTGTGKTAAFVIPMIEILSQNKYSTALIMTPTRELAKQVVDVVNQLLGKSNSIKTACLIGGEAFGKQLSQLRRRPRIIVGTPGRINDHLESETLSLIDCSYLVLDETDRMLDMGFGVQIDQTLKYLPEEKQTLLFSATLPDKIIKLSKKYLSNPQRVAIESKNILLSNIKHEVLQINHNEKYKELLNQLREREGSVLIFVKTKHGTQRMAKNLSKDNFKSDALNGNLNQNKRNRVMSNFRLKKFKVLVATDIASRGLDVDHIEHVINYDLPQLAEDYIHRLGRTGRANSIGSAVTFVSSKELDKWEEIQIMLDPSIKKLNSKNRSSKSKEKKKQFRKTKIKSSLSRNKDRKKGNYSKSKKTNDENSSNFNKFTRKRTSDDTDDKKTFNKKKKRLYKRKFDKDSHTLISSFKKKKSLDKKSKSKFKTNDDSSKKNIRKSKNSKKTGFKNKALNRPKTFNRFKNKFSRAK